MDGPDLSARVHSTAGPNRLVGARLRHIGSHHRVLRRRPACGAGGGLTEVLSVAVSHLGIEPEGMKEVGKIAREPGFVGSLLTIAVLAPLVEELIFRGLLYGWLAGRWGTIVAWIVSSLAFAAAHFEPAHIILVLPLGLWFGWLRRRTDSLWPSLVSHMINNGIAIAAAAYLDV